VSARTDDCEELRNNKIYKTEVLTLRRLGLKRAFGQPIFGLAITRLSTSYHQRWIQVAGMRVDAIAKPTQDGTDRRTTKSCKKLIPSCMQEVDRAAEAVRSNGHVTFKSYQRLRGNDVEADIGLVQVAQAETSRPYRKVSLTPATS
jgi:hypothetical protein